MNQAALIGLQMSAPTLVNGIPVTSLMYSNSGTNISVGNSVNGIAQASPSYYNQQTLTSNQALGYYTPGAVGANNLAQLNGTSSVSANFGGWQINPTQITSPNLGIVLNAQKNEISANSANIGGWQFNSQSMVSPSQTLTFNSVNNNIILYSLGVPSIVIQA